jgi:hypothetical protein
MNTKEKQENTETLWSRKNEIYQQAVRSETRRRAEAAQYRQLHEPKENQEENQ